MNNKQLKRAKELEELIRATSNALGELKRLQDRRKPIVSSNYEGTLGFCYNLCVSEYDDGSGVCAGMSRCEGNQELVCVIVTELERQLQGFQQEFDNL